LSSLGDVIKALESRAKNEADAAAKGIKPKQVFIVTTSNLFIRLTFEIVSDGFLGNTCFPLSTTHLRHPHQVHVPYRDSVLTKLLAGSLGGNARTMMVANVGPAASNTSESLSTIRFAARVKQVKNKPKVDVDPKDAKLKQMAEEIAELRNQVTKMGFRVPVVISWQEGRN
jgi:hypothetical protein